MLKTNEPETKKVPPATHANDTFVTRFNYVLPLAKL